MQDRITLNQTNMLRATIPDGFFIFTSIRYEPNNNADDVDLPYYLLPFHVARLQDAAADFALLRVQGLFQDVQSASQLIKSTVERAVPDQDKPWRVNIKITPSCQVSTSVTELPEVTNQIMSLPQSSHNTIPIHKLLQGERDRRSLQPWDVVVDNIATPASPFTGHKTSVRDMYDSARKRAGLTSFNEHKEVLLWNERGEITEGSITTVYLWRKDGPLSHSTDGFVRKWQLVTPPLDSGPNASSTRRYALSRGLCVIDSVTIDKLSDGDEIWLSNASDGFFPGRIRFLNA